MCSELGKVCKLRQPELFGERPGLRDSGALLLLLLHFPMVLLSKETLLLGESFNRLQFLKCHLKEIKPKC